MAHQSKSEIITQSCTNVALDTITQMYISRIQEEQKRAYFQASFHTSKNENKTIKIRTQMQGEELDRN